MQIEGFLKHHILLVYFISFDGVFACRGEIKKESYLH